MGAALRLEIEPWASFVPISAEIVPLFQKTGVFRRHHVYNNPLLWVDSDGLRPATPDSGGFDPATDEAGLETPWVDPIDFLPIGPGLKTAANVADEAFCKNGFLNANRYLRIGFSRNGGNRVFRLSGDWVITDSKHIILWDFGPLKPK